MVFGFTVLLATLSSGLKGAQSSGEAEVPWITIPVHAIVLSDDDGRYVPNINKGEMRAWVDYTNDVWEAAHINFTFDPEHEVSSYRSTLLNRMNGGGDPKWTDEMNLGNQVAKSYEGMLILLIRYGPGPKPSGGGFSSTGYNFIAMSQAIGSTPNVLAHEAGHFMGLDHTFNHLFKTVAEAEEFIRKDGYRSDMFDGDGLADTPPTPFIEELNERQISELVLAGHRFKVQLGNIQSFWNYPGQVRRNTMTPMQIDRVRTWARIRVRNGMSSIDRVGYSNISNSSPVTPDGFHLDQLDLGPIRQSWGSPSREKTMDGKPFEFGGKTYQWGVATHAKSTWTVNLERNGKAFCSDVAIEDPSRRLGSAAFRVYGDGKLLAESPLMKYGAVFKLRADIRGVKVLRLIVDDYHDGITCDHANWLEPKITLVNPQITPISVQND